MSDQDGQVHEGLGAADAAAMDALVGAGFDASAVAGEHRDRASGIARLLTGLADTATGDAGVLARASLRRIAAADEAVARARTTGWVEDDSGLSEADIEALEALVNAGYEVRRVPAGMRERAQHQQALLSLLALQAPLAQPGADALVQRTLAAVQADIGRQVGRMAIEPARRSERFRLADFASLAAALVIGAVVLFPMLASMRDQSRRAACSANFAAAGVGFGAYAGEYRDSLPMASASIAGTPWWNVGVSPERSNSANLYTLAKARFVKSLEPLSCPGCPSAPRGKCGPDSFDWCRLEDVSYSFQNLFARSRPTWSGQHRMIILADRSPVTLSSARKEPQNPFVNSPNHAGRGQTVLFNDGSAAWSNSPVMTNGDNMWLPQEIELKIKAAEWAARTGLPVLLIGREEPGAPGNVFLGP